MNAIWNIIAKDLTGLRWQALLVIVLQLTYAAILFRPLGAAGPGFSEILLGWLLVVTHLYFIVCAVHAEAIPGDRQYWLTRPFTRPQLLAAKLLLVLLVIHIPLFLSDCLILIGHQFNPLHYLEGLFWRQFLYLFAGTVLMLALAAVTRNFAHFALAAILLIAGVVLLPSLLPWLAMHWGGLSWVRSMLGNLLAATGALVMLWLLYLRRRVNTAWAVLVSAAVLIPVASDLAPFAAAFHVQSSLQSGTPFQPRIQFDPSRVQTAPTVRRINSNQMTLSLPIRFENLPANAAIHADHITATLRLPGGQTHKLRTRGAWSADLSSRAQWVFFPLDKELYERYSGQNVAFDVQLYLTSFGPARTYTMPAKSPESRPMGELGRCVSHPDLVGIIFVSCYTPVHMPSRITAQLFHPATNAVTTRDVRLSDTFNYSPFPADRFQLNPMQQANSHFSIMSVPGSEMMRKSYQVLLECNVRFFVRDAQSHFTSTFTVPSTPLKDLVH